MKKLLVLIFTACVTRLYGAPSFNVDYATFRAGEAELLQVYTMIQRNSLTFRGDDSRLTAKFNYVVAVKRGDSALASITEDRTDAASSRDEITVTQKVPLESSFRIKPGDYTVEVMVTDKSTGETQRRQIEITVENYQYDVLQLSEIEFATAISAANTSGAFIKKQIKALPDADRIYGNGLNAVRYYLEVYNLARAEGRVNYTIYRDILDSGGNIYKSLSEKELPQIASSVVEIDSFIVSDYPSGSYKLRISVADGITKQIAKVSKDFWILDRASMADIQSGGEATELALAIDNLSSAEAAAEIDYIRYLTTSSDNRIISKLMPEGNTGFLHTFWRRNDPTGMMRYRYLARIEAAIERFSSSIEEGWKTDRGRALIIYGEPNSFNRISFKLGSPDSEVWYFDQIEGGVMFVFSDVLGSGDLQQVYSSRVGEYVDMGWVKEMEYLYGMSIGDIITKRPKMMRNE